MSKPLIILFHQEFYFSGGAEHTIFEVIDYLRENNYEVKCYAPIVNKETCFPDKINNYPIYPFFPYFKSIPRELYIILCALLFPILALQFKKASLFYGANQSGPYFAFIASLINHKPFIIYMPYPVNFLYPRKIDKEFSQQQDLSHGGKWLLKIIKYFYKPLDKLIFKKAFAVITEGEYSKDIFTRIYQREIVNCPAGTESISESELNQINKFEGSVSINDDVITKPYILLTNRHMPKKKFEYALEMLQYIKTPTLVITGTFTDYTKTLQKYISQHNLTSNVIFTGLVTEKQIRILYKNAAVYIYTAPEEDYGKGVIQALGAGTPAVVWETGGPGKIITNNVDGYTIPTGNISEFASKVQLLLTDKQLNHDLSHDALQTITTKYSTQKHKEILLNIILLALSN